MTDLPRMDCPVCPAQDIGRGQLACPNCGADLAPLWRLREMGSLAFNRALAAMEAGDPETALARLRAGGGGKASAACGVLAGKILWRLGRRKEAAREWESVASDATHGAEASRLLAEAETGQRKGRRRITAAVVAALIVYVATPLLAVWISRDHRFGQSLSEPGNTALDDAQGLVAEPVGTVEAPGSGADGTPFSSAPSPPLPPALLNDLRSLAGVEAEAAHGAVRIVFRDGLFAGGSNTVGPDGRRTLTSVAGVLASADIPLTVDVMGCTDTIQPGPSSPWADNWSLALGRAYAAMRALRNAAATAQITWRATASSSEPTPYPNATPEDRARNRTVVLAVVGSG